MVEPVNENWFIQVNDISSLWKNQQTYIISQAIYILTGLATLIHAVSKGGRWPYFWLATIFHGLISDNFWAILLPQYDNFWHSQAPVMFFGGRQPLHIVLLYPAFIYNAAYAISRLNLRQSVEPFAVGLLVILIDIPYDIVAVKFVHWVWHDTDPNIFDRHYWVPWNSYYFHATFTASLYYFFHATRSYFAPKFPKWMAAGLVPEIMSLMASSFLGMFGGILLFLPIYHSLHDMYKVHSEVTFFLLFAIFAVIVLVGLIENRRKYSDRLTKCDYLLLILLAAHYLIYLFFVMFMNPENEVSVGYHQPVGPCNQQVSLYNPFGHKLSKGRYLCVTNYDEGYYDFHCVDSNLPSDGSHWYTICGTAFENRVEYITVIFSIAVVAFGVFYGLYFKTVEVKIKTK